MNDDLRNVLGDELFDELSELSKNISENDLNRFDILSEDQLEELANTVFMVEVPMSGSFALQLIASLIHAHESDCETCWAEINMFTISLIGSIISTMMEDLENGTDE
jgi:hypothetical protein